MNIENLTEILNFFGQGIMYGIALGTLVFILGAGVSAAYNFLFREAD